MSPEVRRWWLCLVCQAEFRLKADALIHMRGHRHERCAAPRQRRQYPLPA